MTWSIFTNAIKESELGSGTPAQILIALFKRAGYCNKKEDGISEETAQSWISGKRNCKVYSYFPEGEISNPEEVYNFFRKRPEDKLEKLQEMFCEEKGVSDPVDCETKDMDRFCWSLVNQFLDLLGFQRLELPASDILQENSGGIAEDEIDENADAGQNPEQVSFSGTPTEQMREIFEKAVMDYNIATYICKLSDYLNGEVFYGGDIFAFNDAIENNIISRFLCEQNEKIYKMISEFKLALKNYSGFLVMIRPSISEVYSNMWTMGASYDEIISLIDSDRSEIRDNSGEKVSIKKEEINESSVSSLKEKLVQLDFIHSILLSHKQLSELFGEICPGKTILMF